MILVGVEISPAVISVCVMYTTVRSQRREETAAVGVACRMLSLAAPRTTHPTPKVQSAASLLVMSWRTGHSLELLLENLVRAA